MQQSLMLDDHQEKHYTHMSKISCVNELSDKKGLDFLFFWWHRT